MTTSRDPDFLIQAFLEDGISELPDSSYDVVRAAIEDTRQRVVVGPWREEQVTRFATFGIAAAAVVLVAVVGIQLLPRDGDQAAPGVTLSPVPTAADTPTAGPATPVAPTVRPTPMSTVLPELTEQYTSSMHGMTVSYPAGWQLQPASRPWNRGELDGLWQLAPYADVIFEKEDDTPFIALASQPLGDKTADQWTSDFLATREECEPTQTHTLDGIEGVITTCGEGPHAVVVSEGRAFVVWLYRIDDMEFFGQILATVQLDPTAAQSPIVDPPLGPIRAGTYVAHPFAPPNDGIAFALTVPSDSWAAVDWPLPDGGMSGVALEQVGIAVGFLRVDTLNQNPCNWSGPDDDVDIGPSVDDLVLALTRTKEGIEGASNRYQVSEPAQEVSIGGYSGKQVVVTMPPNVDDCAEGYRIWNGEGFDPDALGPGNRWTLSILDVEGERVVILASDFGDSSPDRLAELQSIVESIEITAP